MQFIKYNTERVSVGGKKIADHYTKPTNLSEASLLDYRNPFNYNELEEIYVWMANGGEFPISNFAIRFDVIPDYLAPNYWEMGDKTFFWSTELGARERQASKSDVTKMMQNLFERTLTKVDNFTYYMRITKPFQRLCGTDAAIIREHRQGFFSIVDIVNLPKKYAIQQIETTLLNS